jgi:phage-related protein
MVGAVHKFYFRLVTKETPNKWRVLFVIKLHRTMTETHIFDTICIFTPDRRRER